MTVRAQSSGDLVMLSNLLNNPDILRQRLLAGAAAEAKRLVQMGFRTETDPDGVPWAPLKGRRGMILRDTGRMANSFTSVATSDGFRVGSNVEYVKYHQEGTKGLRKSYTRRQNFSANLRFTRNKKKGQKEGFARLSTGGPQERTVWRNHQKVTIMVPAKRKLTETGVAGVWTLHFKAGDGKIPIRRMVPADGQLTPRWQESIDRVCNTIMGRAVTQAGGRV